MFYDVDKKELSMALIGFSVIGFMIYGNYFLAKDFCELVQIPFDLALAITSPGFGIDVVIVLTIIECAIIYMLFSQIKKIYLKKYQI